MPILKATVYKAPPLAIALLLSNVMIEFPWNVAIDCSAKYTAPPHYKAMLLS